MTDCNLDPLHFASLGSKPIVADFRGGRLTTDGGALLLREVADRIGLFDALDAAIPDPRHPVFIIHDQRAMIAQRVTAIALGYEDLNDHQTLRSDPALQVAAGKLPDPDITLASTPTLCRLENRVDRKAFVAMAAFPQTPSGKIDRLALPAPMPVRSDLDGPLKAPRNATEIDLVAIWKEILGVEQLGIDDDFLSLGGDSLKAAQIAAYAAFRFRVDVPASAPLLLETVERMAELVSGDTGARGRSAA